MKIDKKEILRKRLSCKGNIIATMGPACMEKEGILNLVKSGAYILRLNFSHGDHEEKRIMLKNIRSVEKQAGTPLTTFQDLQGPKIRLGKIRDGYAKVRMNQKFVLTADDILGDENIASLKPAGIVKDLKVGSEIYINDGLVKLVATKLEGKNVICKVIDDGEISDGRGVNFPGTEVSAPAITEKDKKDLKYGLKAGVDMVALSFVRSAKDIIELRKLMAKYGRVVPVIAKVEKWEAVQAIEEIVEEADVIMIARGDLGAELPLDEVPVVQKRIIEICRKKATPVITATQMMTSMVDNPAPTRAEVSDIANAIYDGSDTLMLSNETSLGKYGEKAVSTMMQVIKSTEKNIRFAYIVPENGAKHEPIEAIAKSAANISEEIDAKAIVCVTETGHTAKLISKYRPSTNIIALTPNDETLRKLAFSWGVVPVATKRLNDDVFAMARKAISDLDLPKKKGNVVIVSGTPTKKTDIVNLIKIDQI